MPSDRRKFYLYRFMRGDVVVYIGKGSGKRFDVQRRRFKGCHGEVFACMFSEEAAIAEEAHLIALHKPEFNATHAGRQAEPWKITLLPVNDRHDREFYRWCDILGTRAMAARILVKKGINVKDIISRVGPIPAEVQFA